MSSKANSACKTIATRNSKNTLDNYKPTLPTSGASSEAVVSVDNCSTIIEVTVTTKGRKRTSTMVTKSPTAQKANEEKRRPCSSNDSHQNWGTILQEQNLSVMRRTAQRMPQIKALKSTKQGSESKDTKKRAQGHQKLEHNHKHLDEIPVKQPSLQRKVEEAVKLTPRTTIPSSTSVASTMDSILVFDKGVQCEGLFDYPDNGLSSFNPVRVLRFLMKELDHLVSDDKASKILGDMKQVLFRIPQEAQKSTSTYDQESVVLRTKLEASTIQLEQTSKKMNKMCEALREERDSLQQHIHKQVLLLNEAQVRQLDLEATVKTLEQKLEDAMKTAQIRESTVSELKEEIKGYEFSQKIIADLRANLREQTELARQRLLEVQYLTLEKDKLSVLSSYKDTLLIELRNAVKELQTHIAEQLTDWKDVCLHGHNCNAQGSFVRGGRACSSPTSTSSHDSNVASSWQDISDVSLSAVEYNPCEDGDEPRLSQRMEKEVPFSENSCGNSDKKQTKSGKDRHAKDSAQLEFISLPGGESSHTLFLPTYKDFDCTDSSQLVANGKEDAVSFSNKKDEGARQSKNADAETRFPEFSHQAPDRKNSNEMQAENQSKDRNYLVSNKKGKTIVDAGDALKISKHNLPNTLIGSTIPEQFQSLFQDFRLGTLTPVNVPSPLREYPNPDWIDSTLPSISTASELNAMQSNDI